MMPAHLGRAFLRVFLLGVFLIAQSAALAHQVWHAAGNSASQQTADLQGDKSKQRATLCDFHAAIGAVLGALSGASASTPSGEPVPIHFFAAASSVASSPALSPSSRGPPAL